MRRTLCYLLATLFLAHSMSPRYLRAQEPLQPSAPGDPQATKKVLLPDGTEISLEMKGAISPEGARKGDVVDFRVLQPVVLDGSVVIAQDAAARGYVAEALKARSWGRPGKLEIHLKDVTCADGTRAPIRATKRVEGGGNTGKVTTAVVISGVFFFPVAPLWGFVKGKQIEIPAGTKFQAFVQGDSTVSVVPEGDKGNEPSASPTQP